MQTQTTQVRVTIPIKLRGYLQTKADRFGLGLPAYIKNLMINDVKDIEYPIYQMSNQAISDFEEAKKAETAGNLIKENDVSGFLKSL